MIDKYAKLWIGSPRGATTVIRLSQYDTSWRLIFTIYDGDSTYALSPRTAVVMNGKKPDGTAFSVIGSTLNGNAVVQPPQSVTEAAGKVECEISFSDDGEQIGTANFIIDVERAPLSGFEASEDDFSAINQLVNQALTAANSAGTAAEAVAVLSSAVSSPLTAATSAAMVNTDKVYVYTGTTSGNYTNGHWYYYDDSDHEWKDGGVYNAVAVNTDTTMSVSDQAADAAAVGALFNKTIMSRSSLSSSIDLDTLITQGGSYYCARTTAATVGHSPWSSDPYVVFVRGSSVSSTASGIVQFAFNSSGAFAARFRYTSTWSDWVYFEDAANNPLSMIVRGSIQNNDDLDDYYSTSGMWYCGYNVAPTVSNTPWNDHGYALFAKSGTSNSVASGQAQFAISYSGEFAWRFRYQGAWGAWYYATTSAQDRLTLVTRGSLPSNCDLDDYYEDSGMWYATSVVAGDSEHVPWDDIAFTLYVKASSNTSSPSGQAQLAISRRGDLAIRSRLQGTWCDWVYYATKNETPLECLSVFSRVAVIGASYDTGASPNVAGTTTVANRNNAWLNILSRKYGFYAGVYAYGGATIQSWYDPSNPTQYSFCYGAFEADDPCELYFITLGGNGTIDGTISDCEAYDADPTRTPTTFYGYYAKMIHDIKAKAPLAAIVCCHPASAGIRGDLEEACAAVDEIAAHYDLPMLDLRTNPSWRKYGIELCAKRTGSSLHPTPMGHAFMAQTYDSVFSNVVIQYSAYFNTWRNEPTT